MDQAIRSFASVISSELGKDILNVPGAGAAGGLGGALLAFCGAELLPGIEILLDAAQIDRLMEDAELIITGEGRIDRQSVSGKVPVGVGRRALKAGRPCIAICGCAGEGAEAVLKEGISAYYTSSDREQSMEELARTCRSSLRKTAEEAIKAFLTRSV